MDIINDTKIVKARKEHICDLCDKKILKGEEYKRTIFKDEELYAWCECFRCEEYVSEAFYTGDFRENGMSNYDFHEYMRENHLDIAKDWWGASNG